MITIQGKGASGGIAAGPLYFYRRAATVTDRRMAEDRDTEWQRFRDAQAQAVEALGALAEKARAEAGDEAAALFETHQLMAEDPDYEDAVEAAIRSGGLCAEAAVSDTGTQFAATFAAMDDYMRERAADVRDVSARILALLTGAAPVAIESDEPVILAADDLTPSETIQLDKSRILGFITALGSVSGHTAILARTMGIPAIVAVGDALREEYAGREVLLDGDAGTAVLDADKATRTQLLAERDAQLARRAQLAQLRGSASVTQDGRRVRICCNIGSPDDVSAVLENDGEGIGLFRSEFLYLSCADYPSEQAQFDAYRKVLTAMDEREVIIRTLDIGADKQIGYFGLPREDNPALGKRALRLCLDRPDLFKTQLRALYRASVYGRLGIMFPMVTSVWEVREAKALCAQVRAELDAEGVLYAPDVKLGIMVETPAAALMSDQLAKEVDFFSCGTNDLTQYTLACDRQNSSLGRFFDPHHPAVLRLLRLVAENAHKNGIWVGICGELAADETLTEIFLSLGIDEHANSRFIWSYYVLFRSISYNFATIIYHFMLPNTASF